MERTEVLDMMGTLKLFGMKDAYDEALATAIKRKHEPQRLVGDLLKAEISEKQARSIKYQMTIAKLPLGKDIDDFAFNGTPINESLLRDLAGGNFVAHQRNVVLVGGTGTGKTHLAIAIARNCIAPDRADASSTPSIWSIASKLKGALVARVGSLTSSPVLTSSSSTNSVTYSSRKPVDNCCSTPQPPLRTHFGHRHHKSRVR
jgi:hypothetical protein